MKWFTYCGNAQTGRDRGYGDRSHIIHTQRRRYESTKRGALGLLLHSDDENDPITDEDLVMFTTSEVIKKMFPDGYYVLPSDTEGDWILTASTGYVFLPDQAELGTPSLRIITSDDDDKPLIHSVNLRQRYNNCRSLVKAVGCSSCPDRGIVCLKRDLSTQMQTAIGDFYRHAVDEDEAKELLKNRKTKVGAFTYISPILTVPEKHHFATAMRHPDDHDFGNIKTNSERIGEGNAKAAEGRRFKKSQCAKCPLKDSCNAFRSCKGAYPVDAEIAKQIIAKFETELANTGPFEPWQFWAIAACGDRRGIWRRDSHTRYNVALHGLEHHYKEGWRVKIFRSKTRLGFLTNINDYATLQAMFGLPDEEHAKAAFGRPENDIAVALYLRLLDVTCVTRRSRGGWGGGEPRGILSKQLMHHGVEVQLHGPRHECRSHTLKNFRNFFDIITHTIGVPQEAHRTSLSIYAND